MKPSARQKLIEELLDGDISDADFLRVEAELSVNPEARREYYERVRLSLLLEDLAAESSVGRDAAEEFAFAADATKVDYRWKWAFTAMAVIAATLLAVLGMQYVVSFTSDGTVTRNQFQAAADESSEHSVLGFAVVSGQANAVWADGQTLADGSLVPPGALTLHSGVVQLELFSGVSLVIEGEADFSLMSPMEVVVVEGKVRARVPEPAHGFRIRTEDGDIVDLGTEFGVNVSSSGSEVHVLDGEIEWHPRGAAARRLAQGEAVRHSRDGGVLATEETDFVGSNELAALLQSNDESRQERWRDVGQQLRHDPRIVAYYRVAESDPLTRRLDNLAASSAVASAGAVVAAAAVPGRWGQPNGALDFSPAGSRVRLTVPGKYRSLTLLCWVKINSLDRWYNSLFLTDGHEEGEPHWQIMDDGRLFFSVKKRDVFDTSRGEFDKHVYYSPPFWDSALSGQWLMIATVYDVDAMQVTHYLNGDVLSEEVIPQEYLVESVRIGNASLCNWGLPERKQPRFAVRNLNGNLDEFILFDAALTAEEIGKLYVDGKP